MDRIILGTMNIAYPYSSNKNQTNEYYKEIIQTYLNSTNKNNAYLDTAYYYGNTKCEQIIGEILPELSWIPKIATKVNPWFENDFSNGKLGELNKVGIKKQLITSLNNLKLSKIEILYIHCYDYETPLKETLEICDSFWRTEKFNYLGISNFSYEQMESVLDICDKYDFIFPSFYQGMYNLLSRKVEEIFPLLDDYKIDFWAYNPLAGGLLTGKYIINGLDIDSRFKDNVIYQNIFWKPEIVNHVSFLFKDNPSHCLTDSLHWLQHFSNLRQNDKIIMGTSTIEQIQTNIKIFTHSVSYPLKKIILLNNCYLTIKEFTPNYYY